MARGDDIVRRNGCTARELNDGGRFLILARERWEAGFAQDGAMRRTDMSIARYRGWGC